jgi:hypothetical protein
MAKKFTLSYFTSLRPPVIEVDIVVHGKTDGPEYPVC